MTYRYAVGKRVVVDCIPYSAFTILSFNGQHTFTNRNARKHMVRILSEDEPELYILTLENGSIINTKIYRYEPRRQPCPYCNR
jgi:uncharacterized protein involved in propanediol utilization